MDKISNTTDVDLLFLTNPTFNTCLSERNKNKIDDKINNKDEINNYKKRIFLLTKDFLKNKPCDDETLNNVFNNYASACIKYLKFKDALKIIQEDHIDYKTNKKPKSTNLKTNVKTDIKNGNILIMNTPEQKADISKFANYKNTSKKTLILPKVRDISYN